MNYFLNTWGIPLFFVRIGILFVLLMGIMFVVDGLLKRRGLSQAWVKCLVFISVFVSIFVILFGMGRILNRLNDGQVEMLTIEQHAGRPSLKVGLKRQNSRRVVSYQTYKFKTYDLATGSLLETEDLGERSVSGDYEIFGSYGRNPVKGDWTFDWADMSECKLARFRGVNRPPSAEPALLLNPEFIQELNPRAAGRKKVWLQHQSALFGPSTSLLTYVDEWGQALSELDLNRMFEDEKTRAIATLSQGDGVLVFITRDGLDLTALKTDPETGRILSRIEYLH